MPVNLKINQHIITWILVFILFLFVGKFWYDFYKKTRPNYKNVVYSKISERNTLDIYLPKYECADTWSCIKPKPYPVVVWIHGGWFETGSKSNPRSLDRLLSEGFAVVSINYRLSDEAKWPAQLTDMQNVIRFIRLNASKYNFNPDKIASWWESAWWYLSSMIAVALVWNPDTKVQAAIDWYGPVDFSTMDEDMQKSNPWEKYELTWEEDSPESQLIGWAVKDNTELAHGASLLTYIRNSDVVNNYTPLLIMHGRKDTNISYLQSQKLNITFQSKFWIGTTEYRFLEWEWHWGGEFDKIEAENKVIWFLRKHLMQAEALK